MRRKVEEIKKVLATQLDSFEKICEYANEDEYLSRKIEVDGRIIPYFHYKTFLKRVKEKNIFTIDDNLLYVKRVMETIKFVDEEEFDVLEKKLKRFYRDKEYFETSMRLNEKIILEAKEIPEEISVLLKETIDNNDKLRILFTELFEDLLYEVKRLRVRISFYE